MCQIQWYLIIENEPLFVSSCKYFRMKSIENKNCIIRKHSYILNVKDIQNAISLSLRNSYYFPVDDSDFLLRGEGWSRDGEEVILYSIFTQCMTISAYAIFSRMFVQ